MISSFEEISASLKEEAEHTGFAIETNILRNDNPEKHLLIKKTIDEFGKGFVLPFKQMIHNYIDTNDELLLNEAVRFYVDEIIPKSCGSRFKSTVIIFLKAFEPSVLIREPPASIEYKDLIFVSSL